MVLCKDLSDVDLQVLSALINGTEDVLQMLRNNGVNIQSTGGETADGMDLRWM